MKVDNICINVCSKDEVCKTIYCNSNQFESGLVPGLKHLDKIFFRMGFAIGIEINTLRRTRGILCDPIFKKCFYMQIRGEDEELSNEDCEYLLEKTQPTIGITIFCELSPDFNYKKILHFSRLRVPNLGNMPLEDLKALNCEIAKFGRHQFNEIDLNEFLHHWIKGNNRKLRRLQLNGFKYAPEWDFLLNGITHTEWNPKERGDLYKSKFTVDMETIDCKNGRDFKDANGQLATVVHHSKFLDFLVWENRFFD
ncbi:hypothetical protein GCK72_008641 [Caenorhabditis remanei]|uniref:Sdz-33 F-box domain-containing protein n=1 Tax=Caenorhabditis remanei TaxID=31234 RepID=A0A6A5H1P6_CAERE|nr:hypothetical protein GCK72_008641 [Caenorhabditis remanei]KAF1760392.1 hypothetical protein GCK72_008641 [Caenorhabditis remanei]